MSRHFGRLDDEVNKILRAGGDPLGQQTAEDVRKYWTWRLKKEQSTHKLDPASKRGKSDRRSLFIQPFSVTSTSEQGQHVAIIITQRTIDFIKTQNTLKSKIGLKDSLGQGEVPTLAGPGFRPAKLYIRELTNNAPTRKSRITGRDYTTKHTASDKGYTIPLGRETAQSSYLTQTTAIGNIIKGFPAPGYSYSFTPENYPIVLDVGALT